MFERLRRLLAAFGSNLRVLCYHAESDSMFEDTEYREYDGLVEDVTGVEWAERRWQEQGQ